MILPAKILRYDGQNVVLEAPLQQNYVVDRQQIQKAFVRLDDGRAISAEQRKKIYAILGDIANWNGDVIDALKQAKELDFIVSTIDSEEGEVEWFSLSPSSPITASMTTAKRFITFLLDFCIEWDVPLSKPGREYSEDIGRFLYSCLVNRRCCLCGLDADIHHVDTIGMGSDRRSISHVGMRAMALCRTHHTEAHQIGQHAFDDRYKVFGIKLGEYEVKKLKLGKTEEQHG